MKRNIILSLVVVSLLSSCGNGISGTWESIVATNENIVTTLNTSVEPFNTVMSLSYFLNDEYVVNKEETLKQISNIYNDTVSDLHRKFDRHYDYYVNDDINLETNLKTINDSYGLNIPIKCSDELYSLLKLGVECYEFTNGQFNIFTGTITDYWEKIFYEAFNYTELSEIDPYFNESQKENLELLVDAIPSNYDEVTRQLTFNDENKTVIFNKCDFNNGIKPIISMGGIAKGYATDIIKENLVNNGYKDGYLISGGSSIATLSTPIFTKKEKGQKISVVNPAKSNIMEKQFAFSFKITKEFNFSTSGNYTTNKSYSFIDKNNKIVYRHHIINPFTGYPESHYRSVSVLTSYFTSAQVDALSTAFMNLSLDEGLKLRKHLLEKYQGSDLELFYLQQEGRKEEAVVTVIATSNVNNTLELSKGVKIKYEE